MGKNELEMRRRLVKRWMISGVAFFIGGWIAWFYLSVAYWNEGKESQWGTLGDSFGSLNTLFSALAVLGAIYAIILQREDFRATLKEYSETKETQKIVARIQIVTTQIEYWKHSLDEFNECYRRGRESEKEMLNRIDGVTIFGTRPFARSFRDEIDREEIRYWLKENFELEVKYDEELLEIRNKLRKGTLKLQRDTEKARSLIRDCLTKSVLELKSLEVKITQEQK